MISQLISPIEAIFGNFTFLVAITFCAFIIKIVITGRLIFSPPTSAATHRIYIFLCLVLTSSLLIDFSWIIHLLYLIFDYSLSHQFNNLLLRLGWIAYLIQCQSIALLLNALMKKHKKFSLQNVCSFGITSCFVVIFSYIAIFNFDCPSDAARTTLELTMLKYIPLYNVLLLICTSLIPALRTLHKNNLPSILTKQLLLFTQSVTLFIVCEIFQTVPFPSITNSYAAVCFSTILVTGMLYICTRKMLRLRFLNSNNRVRSVVHTTFVPHIKRVSKQLSKSRKLIELSHITKLFFQESFNILPEYTELYIQNHNTGGTTHHSHNTQSKIETFLHKADEATVNFFYNSEILNKEELVFTNFYEKNDQQTAVITLLEAIDAALLIPLYEEEDEDLAGYIIVRVAARTKDILYTDIECDAMAVLANHLNVTIDLLKRSNFDALVRMHKEAKEELYFKQREIAQYQESIRTIADAAKEQQCALLFYKNYRFTRANQAAHEIVNYDIHQQPGHPLTKALTRIAQAVEKYRQPQQSMTHDTHGNKIVLSAVTGLERNNVIISIHNPQVTDLISKQIATLKDPSKWDYVLYLETTRSGQLINALLPGTSKTVLDIKIGLLEAALGKKALLLQVPSEDAMDTVELLHTISMRDSLKKITLKEPEQGSGSEFSLFGSSSLLGTSDHIPLFKSLGSNGTIFIENIQFLSMATQNHIAEYLTYGYYHPVKSTEKITSDARIICTSNCDLKKMSNEGHFSSKLYDVLSKTTLSMPQLLLLPQEEFYSVADGMITQLVQHGEIKSLYALTEREKKKLIQVRPTSLHNLKTRLKRLIAEKSEKNDIEYTLVSDPSLDPLISHAARLGRYALRDEKLMLQLWDKFKSQNKIANLLSVNRSSVHNRLKQYRKMV